MVARSARSPWSEGAIQVHEALCHNILLVELAAMTNCRLFYTTNFDGLLEKGLVLHGRQVAVIATEEEIAVAIERDAREDAICQVVKFHGDLEHPDAMVVSEADYRRRLALETTMDDRLKADLLGRVVLFIGYSFRDWNVSYLFHVLTTLHGNAPDSATGRRGYIFVADPSDFEIRLFASREIEVLGVRSGAHMATDIAGILRQITERS